MPDYEAKAAAAARVALKAYALLDGHPSDIQAAVLADLLAIWLVGHIVPGNPAETQATREHLLKLHLEAVRTLIPFNAARIYGE